jgi:hypothetical protein
MAKSLLNKASLLFFFLLPGEFFLPVESQRQNCDAIQLKIEIVNSTVALPKGSVEAIVTGAEKPIYYVFYRESGQLLTRDIYSGKVKDIDPGTYFCSILDGKGCIKKTEFKIE